MLEDRMKDAMGWLGRQVGFIRAAVRYQPDGPQVVYRKEAVEQKPHPQQPDVTLRRTTIDEVIVKKKDE